MLMRVLSYGGGYSYGDGYGFIALITKKGEIDKVICPWGQVSVRPN